MIEIIIKSNNTPICMLSYDSNDEDSMGVLTGRFIPLKEYEKISPIIKKYSKLILEIPMEKIKGNASISSYKKEILRLNLMAFRNDNKMEFSHIELRDFSEDLGSNGYEFMLYK